MLRYQDFLRRIIEESINIASEEYKGSPEYILKGAIAGLRACVDKAPPQLAELLERTRLVHKNAFNKTAIERYMKVTSFMIQVEWVCNVVSAGLVNMGYEAIVPPTMRAAMLASVISKEALEAIN